ncbi:dihydrodipicolinate synthase family protein [Spongiactinospora rosea]|uniref:Dihydrodipicolinate synthase family protein n=1 Tax=Spongiactinospora rosea TaxID=2248750 RepID=A0A366LU63_9ACTN|nr:dihydrodipicolinate synthase family protein [Spongiactinospora rosea]RBQ17496.1 dihydrodipicolinate synthase family protein [Spongiactinospora rosea]
MTSILLPAGRALAEYRLRGAPGPLPVRREPARTRRAYAAAHVVADPLATADPALAPAVDWEATLAFRHHLWDLGLGVADAMDTAQRGMGLPPALVRELITRSCREAIARGAAIVCGAGTDDLPAADFVTIAAIKESYLRQCEWVEDAGGQVVLMASRALCRAARSAEDYLEVYSAVIEAVSGPVILHWLGDMFDPALAGYWGSADLDEATGTVLELVTRYAAKIDGVKMSLLDAGRERDLRRRFPAGVRMFTGDDFNYPELIKGDGQATSDALLGVFAAVAPLAAEGLHRLDAGDTEGYDAVMGPTVPLARAIFEAPTYHYKTGIVFLAYLRGLQDHFTMLGGHQGARSIGHLARLFRLADEAGLIGDADLAVRRMLPVLAASGIDGRSAG